MEDFAENFDYELEALQKWGHVIIDVQLNASQKGLHHLSQPFIILKERLIIVYTLLLRKLLKILVRCRPY